MSYRYDYNMKNNHQTDPDKMEYEINPEADPKKCRLIVNGVPCLQRRAARGLCGTHYGRFKKFGGLEKW